MKRIYIMKHIFTHLFSLLLVFFLITMPVSAEIKDGSAYKINSVYTGKKSLFIANASLDNNLDIIAWTETNVPAQRWIAEDAGDNTFYFRNAYTEIPISVASNRPKVDDRLTQRMNALNYSKWELIPVNDSKYPNAYFMRFAIKATDGTDLFMELTGNSNGSQIKLQSKKNDADSIRQMWTIVAEDILPNKVNNAFRDSVMQGWKRKYFNALKTSTGFWGEAEMMETILDAYETTGKQEYKTMFEQVYEHFVSYPAGWGKSGNGQDWRWNEYNDDIAWAVLASVRAYLMFGQHPNSNINYLNIAKTNYDNMYSRAMIPAGMLRWKQSPSGNQGSNSCINGPAEVAACYLAIATGDDTYYDKAKSLYTLQRKHLYEPATGKVFDSGSWDNGVFKVGNYWVSTYNQGTFLGAAVMLYNRYKDVQYLNDANKIVELTRKDLCNPLGVVKVCGSGDDLQGFKGILMRYLRRYIVDLAVPDRVAWMQRNALHAYNNRNADGVSWTAWWEKTSDNYIFSDGYNFANKGFGASTAVSAAFNAPTDANLIIKNAYQTIEAEHFDYIKGVFTEETENGIYISNINNDFYTAYNNVDFGTDLVNGINISVQSSRQAGRQIEIRKDSPKGDLLGVAEVPSAHPGEWATATGTITPQTGKQNIYLVYKGSGFKVDNFYFTKEANSVYNPISAIFSLRFNQDNNNLYVYSQNIGIIRIYNIQGTELLSANLVEGENVIDFSNHVTGVFVVNVETKDGISTKKFIKN